MGLQIAGHIQLRTARLVNARRGAKVDRVRKLFAAPMLARSRKYEDGRFFFNVVKGRCKTCAGEGFLCVELPISAKRVHRTDPEWSYVMKSATASSSGLLVEAVGVPRTGLPALASSPQPCPSFGSWLRSCAALCSMSTAGTFGTYSGGTAHSAACLQSAVSRT
jgi:hypothetical protein